MAFNVEGRAAETRVRAVTGRDEDYHYSWTTEDDEEIRDCSFEYWSHRTFKRHNFHKNIRIQMLKDIKAGTTFLCPGGCGKSYDPKERRILHIDHIIPWKRYCLSLVESPPEDIGELEDWEVYVGCNDPNNLRVICKHCNTSKGDR